MLKVPPLTFHIPAHTSAVRVHTTTHARTHAHTHTWLFALILMCPVTGVPSAEPGSLSILRFARASSPNIERAYKLAARNPHSPVRAWRTGSGLCGGGGAHLGGHVSLCMSACNHASVLVHTTHVLCPDRTAVQLTSSGVRHLMLVLFTR